MVFSLVLRTGWLNGGNINSTGVSGSDLEPHRKILIKRVTLVTYRDQTASWKLHTMTPCLESFCQMAKDCKQNIPSPFLIQAWPLSESKPQGQDFWTLQPLQAAAPPREVQQVAVHPAQTRVASWPEGVRLMRSREVGLHAPRCSCSKRKR
ncbi:LOW QUALITY PROTEIN: putative uncharacterized protein encoded by LINC01554 [Papio anubis]|uniref:LOW QUALITY PROTEIN: putative uncharacterized protein encoded by LINC01554 n=1 Tax=Papio anubis TaxID=9555 RepID=UPI0012AE2B6F|nr:LOW QUALITY PROTEIN: putative uncharacterized protein encoded by LINC01554 [Papio anubis]